MNKQKTLDAVRTLLQSVGISDYDAKNYFAKKAPDLNNDLYPILKLRTKALQQINPDYYAENEQWIILSSLVAQDIFDLTVNKKSALTEEAIRELHSRRELDREGDVNPFLAGELANAMIRDLEDVIDKSGEIINPRAVKKSHIMEVFHNFKENGIPKDAPMFKDESYLALI